MLLVFEEVARGKCVRSVHHQALGSTFRVTFKDNTPVPQVTPACDVVASDVTLHISPGTHLLIVGPNGCGKSRPYMSVGSLIEQVTYPSRVTGPPAAVAEAEARALHILKLVRLDACAARHGGLPVYALLDECTSAVSMETEVVMKYHTHVLEFDGCGAWSFRPLDKDAPAITSALPPAAASSTNTSSNSNSASSITNS
ncbi:Uncharacterized protein OBRU01_25869, partial [Operophtera brumata]